LIIRAHHHRNVRDHRVAAAPLRRVERAIRRLDQIGGRLAGRRHDRFDADADGDVPARRLGMGDEQVLDGAARLVGECGCAAGIEAR
jgi:hypothetical protein